MFRHQCVEKSDGENSKSDKDDSMTCQLGTRRNRRQVAMVMSINCSADQIQHFMKTIDLNKCTASMYLCRGKGGHSFSLTPAQANVGRIKKFISKHKQTKNKNNSIVSPSPFTVRRYASAVSDAIVRPPVWPSVTHHYYIKTANCTITQTPPHGSPRTLRFLVQRSRPHSNKLTTDGGGGQIEAG